jgi:hypothetical protein
MWQNVLATMLQTISRRRQPVVEAVRLIHLKQRILSQTQPNELLLVQGIGFPLPPYQDDGRRRVPERTNTDTRRKKTSKIRRVKCHIILYSAQQNKTNSFNFIVHTVVFSQVITIPNK